MPRYNFPVPRYRGITGRNDCPVSAGAKSSCVKDLVLPMLSARVATEGGDTIELETVFNPILNALDIDVPDEILEALESINVGPNLQRFLDWLNGLSDAVFDSINVTGNIVVDKGADTGIKIDLTSPDFGFADIIGDQFSKNTGASKPVLTAYNGVINSWLFSAGDEAYISYHIPHDYVKGTPIFLHIHWSHIGTLVTGGTVTFKATSIYAKGHNQAAFNSTPASGTFQGAASTTQYQQILTEVLYSDSTPTGIELDTDLLEPDGIIEMTFEVDANDITVSGGGVPDIFIHFVDLHYQTTSVIGTKSRAPDFYN